MSLLLTAVARRSIERSHQSVLAGPVSPPNFAAARRWVEALNELPEAGSSSEALATGDLVAFAALDDIHRALLKRYLDLHDPALLRRAYAHLIQFIGTAETEEILSIFAEVFGLPQSLSDRLLGPAGRESSKSLESDEVLLHLVLFWLQRRNPAAGKLVERLHVGFETTPAIVSALKQLESFFAGCPGFNEGSLGSDLLAPLVAHPHSLSLQLQFMRDVWAGELGDELWEAQRALDLLAEEAAPRWNGSGDPRVEVPALPQDAERNYAVDRDWMPELVLVAKNTLVWLQQMTTAYGREVSRLDQIPESELELLAGRGITGLWLIGLWERSSASSEIKRRRGNPEAASSAYSLRAYRIADELGGEEALAKLKERASRHGIRLAADMVPNHMGIDSDWVLDHPDRFIAVDEPPYPAYSFGGTDLSPRGDTGIYLEDHYYDGTDAAVVFKHVDRESGRERYIYHGNDGTSTPWNDTAQLDYLNGETREAVIQTILDVARQFPVIRFDAAMTLAKRHYHRLWHPQAGDAGSVPSRSEYSLSKAEIDKAMPREFWREVVDRVSEELPDTLLLAEAFWLMEGYFVRTLGLHRVYNSAFMHLMRDQQTGKFRSLLKETLAFDPEILRRYVNFMSNPDEETAADQFGGGDCYFGVCTVLATLPGLPMFAHGQWDGLREKYGMEYRRSYRKEGPERASIDRHNHEIAPLLRNRTVFAGVEGFRLYDFVDQWGEVREDVLAYSNSCGDELVLIVFNNSPYPVAGSLSVSAPYRPAGSDGPLETTTVRRAILADGGRGFVYRLRDRIRGLSVLTMPENEDAGLSLKLSGFGTLVLDDRGAIEDPTGEWAALAGDLDGEPVEDPERELVARRLGALREPASRVVDGLIGEVSRTRAGRDPAASNSDGQAGLGHGVTAMDEAIMNLLAGPPFDRQHPGADGASADGMERWRSTVDALSLSHPSSRSRAVVDLLRLLPERPAVGWFLILLPLAEELGHRLGDVVDSDDLASLLVAASPLGDKARADLTALLRLAMREQWSATRVVPGIAEIVRMLEGWRTDDDGLLLLGAHEADGVVWIVSEDVDALISARALATIAGGSRLDRGEPDEEAAVEIGWRLVADRMREYAAAAGYRLDDLLERLSRRKPSR